MGGQETAESGEAGHEPASERLRRLLPAILGDWTERVRATLAVAREHQAPALHDHLPAYLEKLADALEPGSGREDACGELEACVLHGEQRALYTNYSLEDVLREYQLLHATLLDRLQDDAPLNERERRIIIDSIHLAVQEAATRFVELQQSLREDADRRKDEFLAMLGHELRNPLGAISNALHLLDRPEVAEARRAHLRTMMGRQLVHLTRLVDDLLDVSRIARGKIQLRCERVDLGALAAHAAQSLRPQLDARSHRLTSALGEGVWVHGDPVRLEQIVGNLLNNSARYTPPGGEIHLSIAIEPAEGKAPPSGNGPAPEPEADAGASCVAVIRVRDNGVGIPAEMLPRVFELFTQGNPTTDRSHGGLGIGLHLVRQLVELHRGTVEARSEGSGRGAEFRVELPLDE